MTGSVASTFFWVILPYLALLSLIGGLIWRFRSDRFGITTRSSQLLEYPLLRIGAPLFHLGLLFVLGGHIIGLLIPKSWTEAAGISEHNYHLGATWMGGLAGLVFVIGLIILLIRRVSNARIWRATTLNDKLMYILLSAVIVAGCIATVRTQILSRSGGYDYRETIGPWIRSILFFQPRPELMAAVPPVFKAHIVLALLLFAVLPFTRLVHAFAIPFGFLLRPYVVYRSPGAGDLASAQWADASYRREWARRGTELTPDRSQPAGWREL